MVAPLPPPVGGVSIWASEYVSAAAAAGISLNIVDISPGGGKVSTASRLRLRRVLQTFGVVGKLRSAVEGAAICHVASTWHWSVFRDALFCRIARRAGAQVVLHLHASTRATDSIRNSGAMKRRATRRLLTPVDLVVTLSDELAVEIRRLCPGMETRKFANPVDTERFSPRPSAQLPDGLLRIVFVGRLSREKGFLELAEVVVSDPTLHLTTIGDRPGDAVGDEAATVNALLDRLAATARHRHFPSLGRDEVAQAYNDADVFALPSHNEGLPMALLEAMASRLPAVITDVGGMADLRREAPDEFAVVASVGDVASLRRCFEELKSVERRRRLGDAGRQLAVRLFASDAVFGELFQEYLGLVERGTAQRRP